MRFQGQSLSNLNTPCLFSRKDLGHLEAFLSPSKVLVNRVPNYFSAAAKEKGHMNKKKSAFHVLNTNVEAKVVVIDDFCS